jgi:CHAT domain-containing protein
MADLARDTGDYAEARALYDRAIGMWSATLGPHHPYTALALEGLARLLRATGDLAGAEPLLRQSLEIWRQAGPEHPLVAINMQNLADVLREKGDYAAARPFYEQALAIREKAGAPNQPEIAMSLTGLADLLRDTGDYDGARPLYERALRIRRTALGPRHPRVAENLNELAKLSWARGDLAAAIDNALEAESITRDHLRITARSLSEREALLYESIRTSGLDVAFSILASGVPGGVAAGASSRVWGELVRSRAIVLDEMAARHRTVFELEGPQLQPLVRNLESARAAYARLAVRGRPEDRPEPYRAALETSRAAMERAERDLAARSGRYRRRAAKSRMGIMEVAAGLPPETAMLAYVQYHRYTLLGTGSSKTLSAPVSAYLALVKRPSSTSVIVIPLGASDSMDLLVRSWRQQVGTPATSVQAEAAYVRAGESLRKAAWDPVARWLVGARSVFVVPDGSLHAVNFSTLPATADHYLIESGPMIHYLSAERDVIDPPARRGPGHGLLLLGGPDYDAGSDRAPARPPIARGTRGAGPCTELQTMRFQPLPSARLEADEVEALWVKNGRAVRKLTGIQASESAFKKGAAGHDVLHLATHGFFINGDCAPLQLSGLALAGANHRDAGGSGIDAGEDGILTAEEIASLDLRGVDWAVLSGCETGVGPVQSGEGVLGLRRAFEVAGAGTLILSLWSVSDHETRDWVHELYKSRLEGRSSIESVRNASLRMLGNRRQSHVTTHPYYWGGFVEAGAWR